MRKNVKYCIKYEFSYSHQLTPVLRPTLSRIKCYIYQVIYDNLLKCYVRMLILATKKFLETLPLPTNCHTLINITQITVQPNCSLLLIQSSYQHLVCLPCSTYDFIQQCLHSVMFAFYIQFNTVTSQCSGVNSIITLIMY